MKNRIPTIAVLSLLLLSTLVFAATASVSFVDGTDGAVLHMDAYQFVASYVNSSGSPITTATCNFVLNYSNGSIAAVLPSAYLSDLGMYSNSSTSLSYLGEGGNYSLGANCTAPGFDASAANASTLKQFFRAGLSFGTFGSGFNVTRYDNFDLFAIYFDSLNSTPSALDPITPAEGGACVMQFVNSTGAIVNSSAMSYNATLLFYQLQGAVGSAGFGLPKGDYSYVTHCTSTLPTENRTHSFSFSVLPLTCAYNMTGSVTLEESATCAGSGAIASAGIAMISVLSDNVTLDCAGFTLTGPASHALYIPILNITGRTGIVVSSCPLNAGVIGLAVNSSSSNTFTSLSFASNGVDVFLSRGVADAFSNTFSALTLASLATWDYAINSAILGNANSSSAIATFGSLTLSTNSSTVAYGSFTLANASGISWSSGVDMKPAYVSVNSLAPALNKPAVITLTTISYANTSVFEVRKDGANCTACFRLGASPASFNVTGFSNYSTTGVSPPPGNASGPAAPPATPPATPPSVPPSTPSGENPADSTPSTANTTSTSTTSQNATRINSTLTNLTRAELRPIPAGLTGLISSSQASLASMSAFLTKFTSEQPLAAGGLAGFILLLFAATTALKLKMQKKPQPQLPKKKL